MVLSYLKSELEAVVLNLLHLDMAASPFFNIRGRVHNAQRDIALQLSLFICSLSDRVAPHVGLIDIDQAMASSTRR